MISYNAAVTLLGLCNIPYDIQRLILLLFIGLGTNTSNIIKKEITFDNDNCNMFVKKIICENDIFTLWRLKINLNKFRILTKFRLKYLEFFHELKIAYLSDGSDELGRKQRIETLTKTIQNNKSADLFNMFYNLDKHTYWIKPYGTQSSIVINNAIKDGIIREFDPMLYYGVVDNDLDEYF